MKLLGIVIENYGELFKREVFNLSPEYVISYDFDGNVLNISKDPEFIPGVYGKWIYSITPIIGKNGCGKSSLLNLIGYTLDDRLDDNRLGFSASRKLTCSYFTVFETSKGDFYLEFFNLRPSNIKENKGDGEKIPKTFKGTYGKDNTVGAVFINNDYEYELVETAPSEDEIEEQRRESVIYFPTDIYRHVYDDIFHSSGLHENVLIRRDYVINERSRETEYWAYLKLCQNEMLFSDLQMKFDIATLQSSGYIRCFDPIVKDTEVLDVYSDVRFVTEDNRDYWGNIYVSFMARFHCIVASDEYGMHFKEEHFKLDYNDFYRELLDISKTRIPEYDEIEKLLFKSFEDKLDDEVWNHYLREYYELNKKLIIWIFRIRNYITQGVGYFILNIPCGSDFNEDIRNFLKVFDKLQKLYGQFAEVDKSVKSADTYGDDLPGYLYRKDFDVAKGDYAGQKLMKPVLIFDTNLISDGEQRILSLISSVLGRFSGCMYERSRNDMEFCNVVPVLVDEIETNMHLEWSRSFISVFEKLIEEYILYTAEGMSKDFRDAYVKLAKLKIQLVFTTHSPFMLSDIVQNNTIVLLRTESRVIKRDIARTFASNIQEIMDNPMFVKEAYGAHAIEVIDEVIADLNNLEESEDLGRFVADKDAELKIINSIGEVFLRNKLLEMYNMKYRKAQMEEQKNYMDRQKGAINDILNNRELNNEQKLSAISRVIR